MGLMGEQQESHGQRCMGVLQGLLLTAALMQLSWVGTRIMYTVITVLSSQHCMRAL
jgi:hypothetical protein